MAIELDKKVLRSYELRRRKYKQRFVWILIIIILLGIIAGAFVMRQMLVKKYTGYEVVHETKRQDSTSAKYMSYGTGILRYSRDGVMALSGNGTILWNGTYEMKDPIVDISGKYVVVADRGSKELQIFNEKGNVSVITVLNNIKKVEIGEQGVVAVLLDGSGVDFIDFYREDGVHLVGTRTINEDHGYPVDITLSKDARKLASSYFLFNNGILQSNVTFFNFGKVGENYVDQRVGGYDYPQMLIPQIEFINNEIVCAFGDSQISVYKMKEIPSLLYEKTFDTEIKSIMYSEKYIGIVLNNYEGEEKHKLLVYDLSGGLVLQENDNFDYDSISMYGEEIIMVNNTNLSILTVKGRKKFDYTFDKNIVHVFPVNGTDRYVIIDDINIEEIRLIEE